MALVLTGCAVQSPMPVRVLGSASHHVMNGAKLIQKGRVGAAQREFETALEYQPHCAHAYRGLSLILGMQGEFEAAFEAVHQAIRFTELEDLGSNEYIALEPGRWTGGSPVQRPEVTAAGGTPLGACFAAEFLNAYYHMGVELKFQGGHEGYKRALEASLFSARAFMQEAREQLLRSMDPAGSGLETRLARGVFFLDRVSRAEAAAVLSMELKLSAHAAGGEEAAESDGGTLPSDLRDHPLREVIGPVAALGLEGLGTYRDGTFRPDAELLRGELAGAAADLVQRLGSGIPTACDLPEQPLLRDVPLSSPYLRPIMACVELGIMAPRDPEAFAPQEPASGSDLARAVNRLKEYLGNAEIGKRKAPEGVKE